MSDLGMIRVATISPVMRVGNPVFNSNEILDCIEKAYKEKAAIIVFPSLCLTGASCGDLFFQDALYKSQMEALNKIALATKKVSAALVLGAYFRINNCLVECSVLLQNGLIKGVTPGHFPSYADGAVDNRQFSPGFMITKTVNVIELFGCRIPFGNVLFKDPVSELCIGLELGGDIASPLSPGASLCLSGAHIICNSASDFSLIGSSAENRRTILQKSKDCICGYAYASSGAWESSSTSVYSGHCAIAESGGLIGEDASFSFENKIVYGDLDYESLIAKRLKSPAFRSPLRADLIQMATMNPLPTLKIKDRLFRQYSKTPFIPKSTKLIEQNCSEAFNIQSVALARRISHTGSKKAIIGISGGLDSTLALLVTVNAMKILNKPAKDVITVTMPGFGTTDKTYTNAMAMMKVLGTEIREIPIQEAVLLHFSDIGHNPEDKNTVYENVQARERTQILMDIANMEGGILVGTGDLSEAALGWSTYNGDHMSMYNVNAGIPKTILRVMIDWFMKKGLNTEDTIAGFSCDDVTLAESLQDVLETPVSPELLPPDEKGNIAQKTEDKVGPYVLHDFFLYHTIRNGTSPTKLLTIAKIAFADEYDEDFIKKWLNVFYRRFFAFQFKRSCVPDSPRVGTINLSPKADWQMPSDADPGIWTNDPGIWINDVD